MDSAPNEKVVNNEHQQKKRKVEDVEGVCKPLKTVEELLAFARSAPAWVDRIEELRPRSSAVVQNVTTDCHVSRQNFVPKLRLDRNSVPRTLVCHDFKGGYLEDKYVNPVNVGNGYVFSRWSQIDVFVYFSHHLITIPPPCWINAAHRNGVKILGTFITEWEDGKQICEHIFRNESSMLEFASVLADVCVLLRTDGWLLNIENKLDNTEILRKFVRFLTEEVHNKRLGGLVIWYDSITMDGNLMWQNELNNKNRCYFDACDGIFLNYTWNEKNLVRTMKAAKHRALDVYVGVDVFGRNTFGGGKFDAHIAAHKIREYNLSMAIFAQAWTHETLPLEPRETFLERFLNRDSAFWKSLWPYLYTHPITQAFSTHFYIGADKDWFKLDQQQQQLSRFLHPKLIHFEYATIPALLETCDCLQLFVDGDQQQHTFCIMSREKLPSDKKYVHNLFSCDILIEGAVLIYVYTKIVEDLVADGDVSLLILVQNPGGSFKEIVCHAGATSCAVYEDFSVCETCPTAAVDVINLIDRTGIPDDWMLQCYSLEHPVCRILEIGAIIENGKSACLCGVGVKQVHSQPSRKI